MENIILTLKYIILSLNGYNSSIIITVVSF